MEETKLVREERGRGADETERERARACERLVSEASPTAHRLKNHESALHIELEKYVIRDDCGGMLSVPSSFIPQQPS